MKTPFLGISFCLFILSSVQAQYIPNSAQPYQFASLLNPAFSGIDNFADIKLSYRYQWAGYGADAPRFINMAYNNRMVQPLDLAANTLRVSNASILDSDNLPKNKRIIQGFGVNFFNEHVGQIERMGGGFNYAYNYPLAKKKRLSFGASALIDNTKVDLNKITLRDADPYYQSLLANGSAQTNLNIRTGVLFYSPTYYVGISYFPILNVALQKSDISTNQIFYKGSIQGGYFFTVAENISIRPSVMALWQTNNKLAVDYSVKGYIQNKVWCGITYRSTKSGVFLLGMNINEKISFTYAFEVPLSNYSKFAGTSHDLVLAYRFNNFRRVNAYTW